MIIVVWVSSIGFYYIYLILSISDNIKKLCTISDLNMIPFGVTYNFYTFSEFSKCMFMVVIISEYIVVSFEKLDA